MFRNIIAAIVGTLAAPIHVLLYIVAFVSGAALGVLTLGIMIFADHPWVVLKEIAVPLLIVCVIANVLRVILYHLTEWIAG